MKHNATIEKYQKFLYTVTGRKVPDTFSADYRLKTLIFRRLVVQLSSYILANGVQMDGKERLGKDFDNKLMTAAKMALAQGVAFVYVEGLKNSAVAVPGQKVDFSGYQLNVFSFADTPGTPGFVPLLDEDISELRAGIRYWFKTVGNDTIFNATLYEEDGSSDWRGIVGKDITPINEKQGYKRNLERNEIFGVLSRDSEQLSRLPIATLWGSDTHESELVGIRESIDCYDLVSSGLANNIDDASELYWILKNTGGMEDADLAQFLQRMKTARAAVVDGSDGVAAEAHTVTVPTEARKTMLEILRKNIYEDAQMLDVQNLSARETTATEIQAAYQAQDGRAADLEYNLIEFIQQICEIAGIPNSEPVFVWNKVINQKEQTEMVLSAAEYLDEQSVLKHLPWILPDEIPEILKRKDEEGMKRMGTLEQQLQNLQQSTTPPQEDQDEPEE